MDNFICSMCKGTFTKGWTDEEATRELEQNFNCSAVEACDIVCDDCYKKIMAS